ncbi:uncharacterized protein LOC136094110 [Hydra vulgaris]|uniref:uncharacterized protein LOC136094110 n=1 Tax=Hydra vulgaris TaxID=6087 RepID=UPI0032E9E4AE
MATSLSCVVPITCVVIGCSNHSTELKKWKKAICEIHKCSREDSNCCCSEPFKLIPFHTEKKDPDRRSPWKKLINRVNSDKSQWEATKYSRVCSQHFINEKYEYPTELLGYNALNKIRQLVPSVSSNYNRPINKRNNNMLSDSFSTKTATISASTCKTASVITAVNKINSNLFKKNSLKNTTFKTEIQANNSKNTLIMQNKVLPVFSSEIQTDDLVTLALKKIKKLKAENSKLQNKIIMQPTKPISVYKKLLSNSNIKFYTNLGSLELFNKLHDFISPYVKKRLNSVPVKRTVSGTLKKVGRARKLYLASRFNISISTCSKIFHSWIRTLAEVCKHLIFVPDLGTLNATSPLRFKKYNNLAAIIDCSEIFIQTPRNLQLQSVTWSEYKHHNTLKFLIAVAPNSFIVYISEAYTGRISDKALTMDCGFLDLLSPFSIVMADKGFNLHDECTARHLFFTVPPGQRGTSQMTPFEVKKTSSIAKIRILVEQIIGRLKTFHLISNELPLTLLPHANNILIVCAAITNMSNPLYKD